jgi:hypothetical protein
MTIRYYTKEWVTALVEKMTSSEDFMREADKLVGTFVFRIYDCPGGLDKTTHWEFQDGRCVRWDYEEQPAPWTELRSAPLNPNWVSRVSCSYEMFAKINRGEMSPMRALTSSGYQIEGKKVLILKMVKAVSAWNDLASTIPVVYE